MGRRTHAPHWLKLAAAATPQGRGSVAVGHGQDRQAEGGKANDILVTSKKTIIS